MTRFGCSTWPSARISRANSPFCAGIADLPHQLQRDFAAERRLPRPINHAHAAPTELALQLEFADVVQTGIFLRHCRRIVGRRLIGPLLDLNGFDRLSQNAGQQPQIIAVEIRLLGGGRRGVAEIGQPLALAVELVEKPDLVGVGVVGEQGMQAVKRRRLCFASSGCVTGKRSLPVLRPAHRDNLAGGNSMAAGHGASR